MPEGPQQHDYKIRGSVGAVCVRCDRSKADIYAEGDRDVCQGQEETPPEEPKSEEEATEEEELEE